MNDIQPYQFESNGTLEAEDDSDCFEESRIIEENSRRTGNIDWCLCEPREPMDCILFFLPTFKSGFWCSLNGAPSNLDYFPMTSGIFRDYYCGSFGYCYKHYIFKIFILRVNCPFNRFRKKLII